MQARVTTAVLLGFVLVAATACGGGSNRTAIDRLESDLAAAEEAREQAQEAAAEAERLRQAEEAAREKAEEEAAEAERLRQAEEMARMEAEEAAAEAERLRQAEEAARIAAEEAQAQAEAEEAEAEEAEEQAQQQAQQAQQQSQQLQEQLTEAEQAELRARASSFGTVLDLGGTANTTPNATSAVTIEWPRGGRLTFTPGGTLDPGSAAPSVPGGWRSAGFAGQTGTASSLVDETVYLYTNIQAPGSRAFWKIHGVDDITAAQGNSAFDPTPTGTARVVRAGADPIDYAVADTYDIAVSGNYDGVPGTYTCSACAITDGDDADSDITAADFSSSTWVMLEGNVRSFVAGNDWSFKPGSISSGVLQAEDTEYLYFGIWSSIPDNISGAGYDFELWQAAKPNQGPIWPTSTS